MSYDGSEEGMAGNEHCRNLLYMYPTKHYTVASYVLSQSIVIEELRLLSSECNKTSIDTCDVFEIKQGRVVKSDHMCIESPLKFTCNSQSVVCMHPCHLPLPLWKSHSFPPVLRTPSFNTHFHLFLTRCTYKALVNMRSKG